MFAPLAGAVRADVDRQLGWAKDEVRRQTRHVALIGIFAGVAALAALGAAIVGLIAVYFWLSVKAGPFTALGVIGGGLLLVALILFALAFVKRHPTLAARPPLQTAQPAALFGALRQDSHDKVIAEVEQTLNTAADALRHGSRSTLLVTLALVACAGLIAGRRLRPPA